MNSSIGPYSNVISYFGYGSMHIIYSPGWFIVAYHFIDIPITLIYAGHIRRGNTPAHTSAGGSWAHGYCSEVILQETSDQSQEKPTSDNIPMSMGALDAST